MCIMVGKCLALQSTKSYQPTIEITLLFMATDQIKALRLRCGNQIGSYIGGIVPESREPTVCCLIGSMTEMMSIEEFRELHARMTAEKPKLFQLIPPDARASEERLKQVELAIGAALPIAYKQFLQEFGGGSFGLANVSSADPEGEFYLPRKQEDVRSYLPSGLIPVSDDFAGGLYVLKVKENHAEEPLWYWNLDGGLRPTEFANVLEFVARYAYKAA
jgi:hypothetical protein